MATTNKTTTRSNEMKIKTTLDNRASIIQNITNDDTIRFDDYNDEGEAIYVSEDDHEIKYFLEKQGNITQHDGWKEKQIGNINKEQRNDYLEK